jgi:hypothetical protein
MLRLRAPMQQIVIFRNSLYPVSKGLLFSANTTSTEIMINYTNVACLGELPKCFYFALATHLYTVAINCIKSIVVHIYTLWYLIHLQRAELAETIVRRAAIIMSHLSLLAPNFTDFKNIFLSNFLFHFCLLSFGLFTAVRIFKIKMSHCTHLLFIVGYLCHLFSGLSLELLLSLHCHSL